MHWRTGPRTPEETHAWFNTLTSPSGILIIFVQGAPRFHFALGPTDQGPVLLGIF